MTTRVSAASSADAVSRQVVSAGQMRSQNLCVDPWMRQTHSKSVWTGQLLVAVAADTPMLCVCNLADCQPLTLRATTAVSNHNHHAVSKPLDIQLHTKHSVTP